MRGYSYEDHSRYTYDVTCPKCHQRDYPYWDGEFRILGPGVFGDADLNVISVNGENYRRQPDRPEPVASAEVRLGDVVEIEADDGSWMVRGEVFEVGPHVGIDYPIGIKADDAVGPAMWPCVPGNTVRVLRLAEPEPDPEQVRALTQLLVDGAPAVASDGYDLEDLAYRLIRNGVTVGGGGDE